MRPCLLSVALVCVALVPACANGSGRNRTDAHVGSPDTGPRTDSAMPMNDAGTMHDAGGGPGNDAAVGNDSGGLIRPDAFVQDTGGPMPDTGCSNDTQCSDGLACNGAERCVSGACLAPIAPMDCSDGLSCTNDSCVEPGTCSHLSTCAGGAACSSTGCSTSCSETPCRLLSPQCGCAAGQACYPAGAMRVCATAGSGTGGAPCTTSSDCAPSYACLNIAASGPAVNMCTHMCAMDSECGGGLCIYQLNDGTGMAVPGLTLCSHPCNVATNAGCSAGSVCTIFQEQTGAMRYFTDCTAPVAGAGEDVSCTVGTDCSPDRYCTDTMDGITPGSLCHHFCNTATGAGCPGGHTCLGFTTPILINGISYGVCSR